MGSCVLPAFLHAQEDTIQLSQKELQAIYINLKAIEITYPFVINPKLSKERIEILNPDDVGELAGKLPGTSIRSYGGLGGLKSISVRGLGGQHSTIVMDGFNLSNTQSGQMNLGQIQADGLESIELLTVPDSKLLTSVSSQLSGSQLVMTSFLNMTKENKKLIKATLRYGSFDRKEAYLAGSKHKNKWSVAGFGKFRQADGEYRFGYVNGPNEVEGVRQNNDFQDFNFGAKFGYEFKNEKKFQIQYRSSKVDQGLAGAVILYNETADERMVTEDHRVLSEFRFHRGINRARVYGNFGFNQLNYSDPTYLNSQGFIDQTFSNYSSHLGYVESGEGYRSSYQWGIEQNIDWMYSTGTELGTPLRSSSYLIAGGSRSIRRIIFEAHLGAQYVYDQNANTEVNSHVQLTPTIRIRRSEKETFQWLTWYKRTFRMPSFNELYFGAVGNQNLQPEIAHQSNIGYRWLPFQGNQKWFGKIGQDVFFNAVQNKIVAIPTKNLFVWSMQNVEDAHVYGTNIDGNVSKRLFDKILLTLYANYTWQKVIDVTENSITKGDQIAYAPEHLANFDFQTKYKNFSFNIANNFVSGRYALNQNVVGNYLDPYWTTDAGLGYRREFKNGHVISAQVNAKNIWNTSYAFIRSYIMPGRHFLISLSYEIH